MKPELKKALYAEVTASLIEQMENGVAVWQQPWAVSKANRPHNPVTGTVYKGFNRMYLGLLQYDIYNSDDTRWYTMNNVKAIDGAQVVKGSKSTIVVFNQLKKFEKEDESGEVEAKQVWLTQYYRVFHASQITGLTEFDATEDMPEQPDADEHTDAVTILDTWCRDNLADFSYSGDRAYYMPAMDSITMPLPDTFKRESWFVQTLAHEVIHATGAEKRLNRLEKGGFGTDTYAKEELVAEFGAAMLSGALGVTPDMEQSAAYMKGWAAKCKEEPGLLISAANAAEYAVDYVTEDVYAVA
jgi:antirestriction protein ArdC